MRSGPSWRKAKGGPVAVAELFSSGSIETPATPPARSMRRMKTGMPNRKYDGVHLQLTMISRITAAPTMLRARTRGLIR